MLSRFINCVLDSISKVGFSSAIVIFPVLRTRKLLFFFQNFCVRFPHRFAVQSQHHKPPLHPAQFWLIFFPFSLSGILSSSVPILSGCRPPSERARAAGGLPFLFSVRPYLFYFPFRQVAINLHFTPGRWDRFVKHYPRRGAAYGRVHERLLRRRLRDRRNTRRNAGPTNGARRFCGDEIIRRRFMSRGLWILNPRHAQPTPNRPGLSAAHAQRTRMHRRIHSDGSNGRTGAFRKRRCSRDRNAPERLYRSHFRHADTGPWMYTSGYT